MADARKVQELSVPPDVLAKAMVVGPRAAIQDVRLIDLKLRLNEALPDDSLTLFRSQRGFGCSRVEGVFDHAEVQVSFKLDMAYDSEESRKSPAATFECTYSLMYEISDLASLDDEHLQAFAQVNGIFNAWPFYRELCSSMTARMGLGHFVLPTMKVTSGEKVPTDASESQES